MDKTFMDGCFDLFHYGHANAIKQAKMSSKYLVCGVNSFEDILKNKGLPVMYDDERYEVVKSCRWVDETIFDVPYSPDITFIQALGCTTVMHGNDFVTNYAGDEVYKDVKAMGRYREFRRTNGISTTEIVGRMLLLERKINKNELADDSELDKLINQFVKVIDKQGKIVFIDGHFDLYHAGHCTAIETAKKEGDYLIVGLHSDTMVQEYSKRFPILNEKERKLALLSNKHVDEIITSPYVLTEDFIIKHGITKILGSYDIKDMSRYADVKKYYYTNFSKNNFSYLSTDHIVNRIIINYQAYVSKQKRSCQ